MNTRRVNVFMCLLMLLVMACGSACSLTRIRAQSADSRSETARAENNDSAATSYKPPKRISKDIIKKDEKPENAGKSKQK